ncbi:hypothetical protein [Oscillatoria acuminata]|uniref:Uncharacterized protein n=1 Tax=Oscillatoria acuminata PCC 6304 TaxID=56110 RepID=K9THA8_9CYAN|nr:hypothetical protein [Oscillatoria acuminata]AFY81930.1 hypothetical protein Oscil6304_2298 [Oscillatoria acuminata PCC 6304]
MLTKLLDSLGEENPQLVRELKGRLNRRSVGIVLFLSAISQCLMGVGFSQKNCIAWSDGVGGLCQNYQVVIQWKVAFQTLSFMLALLLFAGGVYLLTSDLGKEQRRGTLNFLRLSPRTSQNILLGKLLGVPVLLYLGVGLAIPLHLICAIAAGVPLGWVCGFYAVVAALGSLIYMASLLNGLLLTQVQYQAIVSSGVAGWLGSSFLSLIWLLLNWDTSNVQGDGLNWFFWEVIGQNSYLGLSWMFMTLLVGSYWIWQGLNRQFKNPNGTLLSKAQSYGVIASVQIWILGFFYPVINHGYIEETLMPMMLGVSILTVVMFLLIIPAISPQRQTLLDWARYAHEDRRQGLKGYSKWQDWIWGEKSPSVVAIAINLGIVAALWMPWILLWKGGFYVTLTAGIALLMTLNLIWIYSAIAQSLSFIKFPKPGLLSMGIVMAALILPPLVFSLFFKTFSVNTTLWMLFVFGSPWLALTEASAMAIFVSLLGQLAAIVALTFTLNYQLQRAGASHSKLLFAANPTQIAPKV